LSTISAGTRCLTCCEGPWALGTVRRLNEDGTFDVELDVKTMSIMPRWRGVTRAELIVDELDTPPASVPEAPFRLYWNQTRMGGRDPAELARPVTLDDAFAALGLDGDDEDPAAVAALAAHNVRFPDSLRRLATRAGLGEAIETSHPNTPTWIPIESWQLVAHGDATAVTIMEPHQGGFAWTLVFREGADDGEVWVAWSDDGESPMPPRRVSAASLGLFFWDLAQTGLCWYAAVDYEGRAPTRATDLGLAIDG